MVDSDSREELKKIHEVMSSLKKGKFVRTEAGRFAILTSDNYEYRDDYDIDMLFTNGDCETYDTIDPDDIVDCKDSILSMIHIGDYINGQQVVRIGATDLNLPKVILNDYSVITSDSQIKNIFTLEEFNKNSLSESFINKVEELNNEYKKSIGSEASL